MVNTRIKIFFEASVSSSLEKKINEWLATEKITEIKAVLQSECSEGTTISILYLPEIPREVPLNLQGK